MIDFIKRDELKIIQSELRFAGLQNKACAFNAFSLSSYNTHYENFHSDIIASILDPEGAHGEGNLFLQLFIEFINEHYGQSLDVVDYIDAKVERENGKIDVGIRNVKSGKAIIIENKINNAPDMDNQLLRYYKHCCNSGLKVDLIVYLSLDGLKKAPLFPDIQCDHIDLAAFNNAEKDLANSWLLKCQEKAIDPNSKSLINEYYKLLQYLNGKAMENNASEIFYNLINEPDGLNTIQNIVHFYNSITAFRINKLVDRIGKNFSPFTKQYRYKLDSYHLFENYVDGNSSFKLDVWFQQDGMAKIVFWDGKVTNWIPETRTTVKEKLESIDMFDEFVESHYGQNGYEKAFDLGTYGTMGNIDDAVFKFIDKLLDALRVKDLEKKVMSINK